MRALHAHRLAPLTTKSASRSPHSMNTRPIWFAISCAPPDFSGGFLFAGARDLAVDQDELTLQMAAFADAVRLRRLGERVTGDRGRPDGASVVKLLHEFEVGAVARDARAEHLDIGARRLKAGRGRRDADEPAAGLQNLVGAHLHVASDRVEHDIAAGDGFCEIFLLV